MAKKRSDKPENPIDSWERTPVALQMRGSTDWKKWIEGLAEFDATTVAEVVERATAAYARQIGYTAVRPKR